jgi:pilus assembly protein Flp/PilA
MEILNRVVSRLRLWNDTRGQDLLEYALTAGLIAVAVVACMPLLGRTVNHVFETIGSMFNAAAQ